MRKIVLTISFFGFLTLLACKKEVQVTPAAATDSTTSTASSDKNVNLADLPAAALTLINKYYKQDNIASYEIKTIPIVGKSFEVKFNDGSEIGFQENGDWHEWKDAKGLPADILPLAIKTYLTNNYSKTFATSIEKESKKINIELASGVDLEFDQDGNFVRIDQ